MTYHRDVLPILTARCLKCHGSDKPKAGLDLRSRAGLVKGGEAGPALVPGKSDRSLLFQMIQKGEMPPQKDKLPPDQVALVKAWIDTGAHGTPVNEGSARKVIQGDRDFWAFRKPVRPPVPAVRHEAQVRTPITDGFGKPWVWRAKDLWNWWSNSHVDRPTGTELASPTAWTHNGRGLGAPDTWRSNSPNVR